MTRDEIISGLEREIKSIRREPRGKMLGIFMTADEAEDIIAMLKEQEAVAPYMDYDGHDVWRCGKCGATIFHIYRNESDEDWKNYAKFCRRCGKKVKWE